jgi:hypothetical protein
LIIAKLAEASQEEEELRRRNQELEQTEEQLRRRLQDFENVQNRAVTATVVVDNSGGGDHDQTAGPSPFGRKGIRFLIGAALALLLVVGVILGVTLPLTTNKDKDSPSIDSTVTPSQCPAPTVAPTVAPTAAPIAAPTLSTAPAAAPTAAPTAAPIAAPIAAPTLSTAPTAAPTVTPTQFPAPTKAPTKAPTTAPTACTSRECLLGEILLQNEVSDAEALQDDSSPQFQALRWLANDDTAVLDLESTPTVIIVEQYVLAVLYFATRGEGWGDQLNFLSASSVCEWNNGSKGVSCNEDDLVVALFLGELKHGEVINLTSQFCICVPMLTFRCNSI